MKRQPTILAIASVIAILLPTGFALGHSPIQGASRQYVAGDPVLEWKFNAAYPAWLTSAIEAGLNDTSTHDAAWDSTTTNNSKIQNFTMSSTGSGRIKYTAGDADGTSPCTSSSSWIMCADNDRDNNGTKSDWWIFVRNFDVDPISFQGVPGRWADDGSSTANVDFDVERNVMHEAIHITMGVGNHDPQAATVTLMTTVSPDDNDTDWAVHHLQECDQARAQLIFGMASSTGKVAQCFDDDAIGHFTLNGLATIASLSQASSPCIGDTFTVSGSLKISTFADYGALAGAPLGGRSVVVKKNGVTAFTATTSSTGTFSGSVLANSSSLSFTASYAGEAPDALAADTSPVMTVSVIPSPPC